MIGQKKNRDYYRCILFDQEITIIETKIGFTGIHLQNCDSKSDFFGEGHFHKSGGGAFCPSVKKKKFLCMISVLKQIGWNCSKDKNRNKRHAIHGSLEQAL